MNFDKEVHHFYSDESTIAYYQQLKNFKAEEVIFRQYASKINGGNVLDIGIGTGRTTAALIGQAGSYTGIDIVPEMVERAKKIFPGADIFVADAREISKAAKKKYDFVMFSFNGIDYLNHEDRQRLLSDIYEILNSGGVFCFSTYNRSYKYFDKFPWQKNLPLNKGNIAYMLKCLAHVPVKWKMRKYEMDAPGYAVRATETHFYKTLFHYITTRQQVEDLKSSGFANCQAYHTHTGEKITDTDEIPFVYYCAEKT